MLTKRFTSKHHHMWGKKREGDDLFHRPNTVRTCTYPRVFYGIYESVSFVLDAVQLGLQVQVGKDVSAFRDGMHIYQVSRGLLL